MIIGLVKAGIAFRLLAWGGMELARHYGPKVDRKLGL